MEKERQRYLAGGLPYVQARFGGGPTEKARATETSPAAYPTLETSGGSAPLAEFNRAIRPGVLWRKGRLGTHSADGSPFVEALMTVVATLKPQHRHVLDYLTAACEAAQRGEPAPSLLPTPDTLRKLVYPAA